MNWRANISSADRFRTLTGNSPSTPRPTASTTPATAITTSQTRIILRSALARPPTTVFISERSLKTDTSGIAKLDVVGDLQDEPGSRRWRVEAAIRDEAGQTIYEGADLVVHQGLLYVGARAEDYVGRVGDDSIINIIAVDWNSQPIAYQDVDVQVVERRWTTCSGTGSRTPVVPPRSGMLQEIPVASGSVTTGGDGEARFLYQPPNGGTFKVIVSTRDKLGNSVSATTRSWVSSSSHLSAGGMRTTKQLSWFRTRRTIG